LIRQCLNPKQKEWFDKKLNKIYSKENFFEMLSGVHLDIYLSIMTNIKFYKKGDWVNELNYILSYLMGLFLLFVILYFAFQAAIMLTIIEDEKQKIISAERREKLVLMGIYKREDVKTFQNNKVLAKDQGEKEENPDLYLINGVDLNNNYGRFFKVYMLLKDPMIAFSIVLLKKFTLAQVLIPLALFVAMSVLESIFKPIIDKKDRIVSVVTKYLFSLVIGIYLSIVFLADPLNYHEHNVYFGYPLICLYSLIMLTNIYPILHRLIQGLKTLFITLKNRKKLAKVSDC
jgi:hypothetical protein